MIRRGSLVVLCALLLGAPTVAAVAADAPDGTVTWSVVPAEADGPDGRRTIDVELAGGESVTEHVAVTNHSGTEVDFAVAANDGYLTARGSFDMLPSDTLPTDGGSWIDVPSTVTVPAGGTVVVPVEISVPSSATPGDHPAGVAASVVSGDGEVAVESRVGVRVDLRVTGDVVAAVDVTDVTASYEPSVNPFEPGAVEVSYRVANEGNVRVQTGGTVAVNGWGAGATRAVEGSEVLPEGASGVEVRVERVWPVGLVTAEVTVEPEAVGSDEAVASAVVVRTVTLWALPLPQLLVLVVVLLVVAAVVVDRRRRRAALDRRIAAARAEGAAEALARVGSDAGPASDETTAGRQTSGP